MGRKSAVPPIKTVIDNDPATVRDYQLEYIGVQRDFHPNDGYKTHFNNEGFVSRNEVSKKSNQALARMAATCMQILAERGEGKIPQGNRYTESCNSDDANALFSAVQNAMPKMRRFAKRLIQIEQFEETAKQIGVSVEQFMKQNDIALEPDPFESKSKGKSKSKGNSSVEAKPSPANEESKVTETA